LNSDLVRPGVDGDDELLAPEEIEDRIRLLVVLP